MSAHPRDDLLAAFVDGTASAADRDAVEAHLRACPQCRADVQLARGARGALRRLPGELDLPVDIAAAVLAEAEVPDRRASGRPAAGSGSSATPPPRWYRAAAVVAAAAVIALAVVAIPRLGDESPSATTAEAGGDTAAGAQAADRVVAPSVEARDYDDVSLAALASREAEQARVGKASFSSAENGGAAPAASSPAEDAAGARVDAARATTCVREGSAHPLVAADAVPAESRLVRIVAAGFEGTDAFLGTFVVPPTGTPTTVTVVAVARDDCRYLGSAAHGV